MSRVLATRLKRLEKRHRNRRPLPTVIAGIYPEEAGPIVGIEGGGKLIRLEAGETLAGLQARAVRELPARFLAIRYMAPVAAPRPVPAPVAPAPDPWPAFDRSQPEAWRQYRQFAEEGMKP